jgi:hypothetical protein
MQIRNLIIIIFLLIIVLIVVCCQTSRRTLINDWASFAYVEPQDSIHILEVCTEDSNSSKLIYCKAVFKNIKTGQFKCIAPWIDNGIFVSSIDDIKKMKSK